MNLAVKFNLLKDTQPHYIYKPESCVDLENTLVVEIQKGILL
jgi:hypothetical protein